MELTTLKSFFNTSPVIRLLNADNKAFIISFLYQQFRPDNKIIDSIPLNDFERKLEVYMENNENFMETQRTAQDYINEWSTDDKGYLIKDDYNKQKIMVSATSELQMVFQWIENLISQGTNESIAIDSKFSTILLQLNDIKDNSTTDIEQKRLDLIAKRDKIDEQLLNLDKGFLQLDEQAIRDRFTEATKMIRVLLSDFKQVENNIKIIIDQLYQRQLDLTLSEGSHIGFTVLAQRELLQTPQGKSIERFQKLQRNDMERDNLNALINYIIELPAIKESNMDTYLIDRLQGFLTTANDGVVQYNRQLIEQLDRALTVKNTEKNQKIHEHIHAIKTLCLENKSIFTPTSTFIEIEDKTVITLPLERRIDFNLNQTEDFNSFTITSIDKKEQQDRHNQVVKERLNPFEKQKLIKRIEEFTTLYGQVSLKNILDKYPITNGLSELLAYYIIANQSSKHIINHTVIENVEVSKAPTFKATVQMPQIIFKQ